VGGDAQGNLVLLELDDEQFQPVPATSFSSMPATALTRHGWDNDVIVGLEFVLLVGIGRDLLDGGGTSGEGVLAAVIFLWGKIGGYRWGAGFLHSSGFERSGSYLEFRENGRNTRHPIGWHSFIYSERFQEIQRL
jgi:hypothetical protein